MEIRDFETQLRGGRLTTAEVLYYLPDYPDLLQRFVADPGRGPGLPAGAALPGFLAA